MPAAPLNASLLPRTAELRFERFGFCFTQLTGSRWRISNQHGAIVGYLDDAGESTNPSDRWVISRMTADRRRFVTLGSFATREDAIDALKWM